MIFIKKEYLKHINLNEKYITYPELLFDDTSLIENKNIKNYFQIMNVLKKNTQKIKINFLIK